MSKVPKPIPDRLLNLLYTTTAKEISNRTPIVTKYLYAHHDPLPQPPQHSDLIQGDARAGSLTQNAGSIQGDARAGSLPQQSSLPKSELDDLMNNPWKHQPIVDAVSELPNTAQTKHKSIVLKFKCQSSLLTPADFQNIYPINRERRFLLDKPLRNGLRFTVVKSRNPTNLMFNGSYYLIFPNYNHACLYWLETLGKHINGYDIRLEFVNVSDNELKNMSSPFYHPQINNQLTPEFHQKIASHASGKLPIKDIFQPSSHHARNLDEIHTLLNSSQYNAVDHLQYDSDPMFQILNRFTMPSFRRQNVIVKNLPFNLSKFTLKNLLWDYNLAPLSNPSLCFTNLVMNPMSQTSVTLIRFADNETARRFVRNFHGRHWDIIQGGDNKEKKLYDPILCELAE